MVISLSPIPCPAAVHPHIYMEPFPKLGVLFLGVPIIRITVFWGLYWRPLMETTMWGFTEIGAASLGVFL